MNLTRNQIEEWKKVADSWNIYCDWTLQGKAPSDRNCKTCWDTWLCAECLGEYPGQCPVCSGYDTPGQCGCRQ